MSNRNAIRWKALAVALLIPLCAGGLAALLSHAGMDAFRRLEQPPLSPPAWVFPAAWSALYLLMGLSSYLAYRAPGTREERKAAAWVYWAQLAVNVLWPLFFFTLEWRLFAFFWLLLLLALAGGVAYAFERVSRAAGWLQAPYLAWLLFAAYLNAGVWLLN